MPRGPARGPHGGTTAAVELDHVLVAVLDLDEATRTFVEEHGLLVTDGGRHPGWGTANRIVPLGDAYLELIAVIDELEASATAFGRWVADGATAAGNPIGWAVRPANLDETAQRLGLKPQDGSRLRPDGELVRWRSAGLDEAVHEPSLPFFIEWAPGTAFPGSLSHGEAPRAVISRLEIDADPDAVSTWLGSHSLPVQLSPGRAAVRRVVLATRSGEVVLGEPSGPS